ncbi:MAG: leucyl/phenylalanyl-tRNA--protein transferase [Campylobacteraceae bacterium]|jgi:leucyl/phenylalanyl-tRNA--protein transferase|nr:leucyl/phenylalanyl-tRNA--protein transferase [Campylobacteraceae bacterium]
MVYLLKKDDFTFPPPQDAELSGLLAYGGDYDTQRLINAYQNGIFPWPKEGYLPLWFSPDPRAVLYPKELRVSRSLRQSLKKYEIRFDTDFEAVITNCAQSPARKNATWITGEIKEAYCKLHLLGLAHSVESYDVEGRLVGGLYGIGLGNLFCGESMFALKSDASKAALFALCQKVEKAEGFIDCQVINSHLSSLGAVEISRDKFLQKLQESLFKPVIFKV